MDLSVIREFKRSWLTSTIGVILFFCGLWLLTWNEGRAVYHSNSLDEAYNNVISINPNDKTLPEYNDRLIYAKGLISTNEPLTEPDYGISIQAVKLKRRVQMYQWIEEQTQNDFANNDNADQFNQLDTKKYYYTTEWRDKLVDSSNFYFKHGHENPLVMPLNSFTHIVPIAKVGNLMLGKELKEKFKNYQEVTGDNRPERSDIKLHMGIYYHCDDVWNPEVGDIRVQFYYSGLIGDEVSIIGRYNNGVLIPYKTSKGHQILFLREGTLSISQMFSEEHKDARYETWKLRGGGMALLYASFVLLAKIFRLTMLRTTLFHSIGLSESRNLINFILSLSVSLLIISLAWIMYRPWLGAALLMAAVSPFMYCTLGIFEMAQI